MKETNSNIQVILVNEKDEVIGSAEKLEAHQKGLLHRAFSVFIFNKSGEVLLQKRSKNKYHCGGLWTNTCCSHPFTTEPTIKTAQKRLEYEMGISSKLTYKGSFIYKAEFVNGLTEHEFDHVYVGNSDEIPAPNPEEVESYEWISLPQLQSKLKASPEIFTPWIEPALKIAL